MKRMKKTHIIVTAGLVGMLTIGNTFISFADTKTTDISDYVDVEGMSVTVPEDMLVADVNSFLNIRLEPNSSSEIIAKMEMGNSVEVVEYLDDWVKVKVGDMEGYVFTDYTLSGKKMGKYIANNLDLFKKTVKQQECGFKPVYKTKKAAKENAAEFVIKGKMNTDTKVYCTKSKDEVIEDQILELQKCIVKKSGDGLRLRSKPDEKKGEILDSLEAGDKVDFVAYENNDWVKVKKDGIIGYVAREYVRVKWVEEPVSNIYSQVEKGDKVTITDVKNSWVEIEDEEGIKGYVKRKYVDLSVKTTKEDEDLLGYMENDVCYELDSVSDKVSKVILADGKEGYTLSEGLKVEVLLDEPEVTYVEPEVPTAEKYDIDLKDQKVSKERKEIVKFALKFVGNPYVWGGTSLTKGTDCSGFTQQVLKHAGINISRTSYQQPDDGKEIDFKDLRAGDLVFYWNNEAGRIGHVAMYIGDGKVVHASSRKTGIKVSKWNYRTPYMAVDVIGD